MSWSIHHEIALGRQKKHRITQQSYTLPVIIHEFQLFRRDVMRIFGAKRAVEKKGEAKSE